MITSLVNLESTYADKTQLIAVNLNDVFVLDYATAHVLPDLGRTIVISSAWRSYDRQGHSQISTKHDSSSACPLTLAFSCCKGHACNQRVYSTMHFNGHVTSTIATITTPVGVV